MRISIRGDYSIFGPRTAAGQGDGNWGRAGVRDSLGEPIHDDHLMVDALVSELDDLEWAAPTPTVIIAAPDPLSGMERAF